MIAPISTVKGACGCGCTAGGTPRTSSSCRCGTCEQCQTESFVRPQFFSGQLLTEEDLELLGEYSVAKNRLHNRHFWGDGVVCGLEVSCHPCGGGIVVVQAGYALDCCGNDIVVPCAKEIDINAMVRELRISSQGGFDCGDPCTDKATPHPGTQPGATGTIAGTTSPSTNTSAATLAHGSSTADVREYCLYVRYCEQPADPVKPYDTGEACGAETCKPTRVREGFRFELRCREETDCCAGSLAEKICCCLKDEASTARIEATRSFFARYYQSHLAAVSRAQRTGNPIVSRDKADAASEVLHSRLPPAAETWTEAQFLEAMDAAHNLLVFEAGRIATEGRTEIREFAVTGETPSLLRRLSEAAKRQSEVVNKLSPLDAAYYSAVVDQIDRFSGYAQLTQAQVGPDIQLLAAGMVPSPTFLAQLDASVRALRFDLVDRAHNKPRKTDCTAESRLRAVYVPGSFQPAGAAASEAKAYLTSMYEATTPLTKHAKDLLLECFCDNINPPCPACTDLGVLLACLEVRDCEVVRICNLERKFVLTPVALRYWFPILCQIGQAIEEQCCPAVDCPPSDEETDLDETPGGSGHPILSQRQSPGTSVIRHYLGQLLQFQLASCCESFKEGGAMKGQLARIGLLDSRRAFDPISIAAPTAATSTRAPETVADARERQRLRRRVADLERRLQKLEKAGP